MSTSRNQIVHWPGPDPEGTRAQQTTMAHGALESAWRIEAMSNNGAWRIEEPGKATTTTHAKAKAPVPVHAAEDTREGNRNHAEPSPKATLQH